ncbi:MAG: class I tRNA ligase family protein, partial [Candidatus Micrarchaeota archaeon]|nr:class I tRNA ligase family protein [Candidatus Micrarchaeota archaeon]
MADLPAIEQEILAYWKANAIYSKVKAKNAGGAPFFFCDGPPYATGQIHPGTAWNKSIKDCILRYKRANGFRVRDQPGYDTHGLPIEVKVEQELKINNKKQIEQIGVAKFVQRCKTFASQYIGVISQQFERCGVWMDWERPYVTYQDSYIEAIWRTMAAAHEKKLLTEGVYVVPQCVRCETSLANYELEYEDQDDPSLYVKFKVKGTVSEYLVIWTTTPWTLVANMAVMVHPTHPYVKVKVGAETWIVAKERLDNVMAFRPLESAVLVGELSGKKLEGLQYEHPLDGKIGS